MRRGEGRSEQFSSPPNETKTGHYSESNKKKSHLNQETCSTLDIHHNNHYYHQKHPTNSPIWEISLIDRSKPLTHPSEHESPIANWLFPTYPHHDRYLSTMLPIWHTQHTSLPSFHPCHHASPSSEKTLALMNEASFLSVRRTRTAYEDHGRKSEMNETWILFFFLASANWTEDGKPELCLSINSKIINDGFTWLHNLSIANPLNVANYWPNFVQYTSELRIFVDPGMSR